jgi:hypothetical protein
MAEREVIYFPFWTQIASPSKKLSSYTHIKELSLGRTYYLDLVRI